MYWLTGSAIILPNNLLYAFAAGMTACACVLLMGPPFIRLAKKKSRGQHIRPEGPVSHYAKQGTPTMGGVFLFAGAAAAAVLFADLRQPRPKAALLAMFLFGLVGLLDDLLKERRRSHEGLSFSMKLFLQAVVSAAVLLQLRQTVGPALTEVYFPWNPQRTIQMGIWFYLIAPGAMVLFVNAVNLSDGLDGLAGGLVLAMLIFFMAAVNSGPMEGLLSEVERRHLTTVIAAAAGATGGFLRFNLKPATVFMGDAGSQGLGGFLITVALVTHMELLAILAGAVFVAESVSVIIQVASFKLFGKRVFQMAPLHHHYEMKGLSELQIVRRFWAAGLVCAAGALILAAVRIGGQV